jgi:metal-dependent HD superfamily phosphatase/phosphodiesterase
LEKETSQPSGLRQRKINNIPHISALHGNLRALAYIDSADRYLEAIGYTEHGFRHCEIVSKTASLILRKLGYDDVAAGLAEAAGFLHDIGNMLGRANHHRMGALLAKEILEEEGFDLDSVVKVMRAIVIHEEDEGVIPDEICAALVIADKADVHRSRVRNPSMVTEDIHDRVNFAATESELSVDPGERLITLDLTIDTRISQVIEYFEIFLERMTACRKAAKVLGCEFNLFINHIRMA